MTDAVPKFERLMNLVAFLLASAEPVPFATIRKTVVGYNDLAREDAVEKRFDRDKKELREIGIPVEYTPSDEQGRDGYFIPLEEYFHHELDLTAEEATLLVVLANAARVGNEMGADLVKVSYTGSPETFREVVAGCAVPVVIAGGPKMNSDKDILEMVKGSIDAGGAGVSIGRNVFQHKDPTAMIRAISAIVNEGAGVDEALEFLE